MSFITLGVVSTLDGTTTPFMSTGLALLCGLVWNVVRNQGAWLRGDYVVLEAAMGRAKIPVSDVIEVHVDEDLTTLGVKTSRAYVVQSIASPVTFSVKLDARFRTNRVLGERGISPVWHGSIGEVYSVATSTSPFMWRGAVLGTLTRPLVWGFALAGLLYGLAVANG